MNACTSCLSASGLPWVKRLFARRAIMSTARCAIADGPHRVVDAPAGQPGLQDHEAVPGLAQHRRRGHPDVVVVDQRMPGLVGQRTDEVMGGLDVQPRGAGRDQERRRAAVNRYVRIGDGDDDEERRHRRVGRKVLAPGDHPVVTVDARRVVVNTRGSAPPCGSVIEKQEKISPDSSPAR